MSGAINEQLNDVPRPELPRHDNASASASSFNSNNIPQTRHFSFNVPSPFQQQQQFLSLDAIAHTAFGPQDPLRDLRLSGDQSRGRDPLGSNHSAYNLGPGPTVPTAPVGFPTTSGDVPPFLVPNAAVYGGGGGGGGGASTEHHTVDVASHSHSQPQPGPGTLHQDDTQMRIITPAPLHLMQNDLAILSAEQYDDGSSVRRSRVVKPPRKSPPQQGGDGSKKRSRAQTVAAAAAVAAAADQDDGLDELDKKRARGRPRLDTEDQTPQERRRTQIRLAQRAYRNRKESAISSLEKKVEGLQEVNEQMNQEYRSLFDYATRNGLLEQAPEFGQRLLRLEALAKRAGEEEGGNDDREGISEDVGQASKPPPSNGRVSIPTTEAFEPPTQPQHQQLWGGLIVTHEPVEHPQQSFHNPIPDLLTTHHHHHQGTTIFPAGPIGYEIIAQPTSQNASFAPPLSFDPSSFLSNFNHANWTPTPWNTLPAPSSYTHHEPSFGRRLHRSALQRAAKLITMKSPPPDRLMRVFGFVRLFETYDQIRERTLGLLAQSDVESLAYWRHPFHHLGGAGTHFPEAGGSALRGVHASSNGNAGPSTLNLRNGAGRVTADRDAMGPFDRRVTTMKAKLMELGNQMDLPGFEGIFWDCDEVDWYLIQNGISIPFLSDFCTVELDETAMTSRSPPAQTFQGSGATAGATDSNMSGLQQQQQHDPIPSSSASVSGVSAGVGMGADNLAGGPIPNPVPSSMSGSTGLSSPVSGSDGWLPPSSSVSSVGSNFFMQQQQQHGFSGGVAGLTAFDDQMPMGVSYGDMFSAGAGMGDLLGGGGAVADQSRGMGLGRRQQRGVPKVWKIDVERLMDRK